MSGKKIQTVFFQCPVFQNLRRQLHKVPVYVSATQAAIVAFGQHAMECVPKLVKEGLHFIEGQQRGGRLGGFGEAAYNADVGSLVVTVHFFLLTKHCHPRTASFAFPGEEVGVEDGHWLAVFITHLIHQHIGVVPVNLLILHEVNTKQLSCHGKHSFNHLFQLKIGFEQLIVHFILFLFQLLAVVGKVPPFNGFQPIELFGVCCKLLNVFLGGWV